MTTPVPPKSAPKPGWKSTELYTTVFGGGLLLLVGLGVIDPTSSASLNAQASHFADLAAGIAVAGYSLGRSLVKAFHQP